jgi:tRNA A37 threonylcarbamoyladenosine modification protein TsaB
VRGGICAAQGFGLALGIEVLGVCSLFGVELDRFVAVGDAGRRMAYVAHVDRMAGIFVSRLVMITEVASVIRELQDVLVQISSAIEGVDAPVVEPQARALLQWLEDSAVGEKELRERPLRPIYLQGAVAEQPACQQTLRA